MVARASVKVDFEPAQDNIPLPAPADRPDSIEVALASADITNSIQASVAILHGSATTTEAVCRAIQNSRESLRVFSRRYGINQKTVAKWKKRASAADRAGRAALSGSAAGGRSHHCRLPQAYKAAP